VTPRSPAAPRRPGRTARTAGTSGPRPRSPPVIDTSRGNRKPANTDDELADTTTSVSRRDQPTQHCRRGRGRGRPSIRVAIFSGSPLLLFCSQSQPARPQDGLAGADLGRAVHSSCDRKQPSSRPLSRACHMPGRVYGSGAWAAATFRRIVWSRLAARWGSGGRRTIRSA
jgi:hypothetical protein